MEINYRNLEARAKDTALEYMPSMPKQNTLEAWQAYSQALMDLESTEIANEEADSWDWVIYYGQAMDLCANVPSSILHRAETMVQECGNVEYEFESGGLYGVACVCAYHIVYFAICEAVENLREELLELANGQIENLEGVAA